MTCTGMILPLGPAVPGWGGCVWDVMAVVAVLAECALGPLGSLLPGLS